MCAFVSSEASVVVVRYFFSKEEINLAGGWNVGFFEVKNLKLV